MNDRTADREGLAQAMLDAHRARLGFDPIPLHDCAGPEDYLQPADAILASPQFARIIAEAEDRARLEVYRYVHGLLGDNTHEVIEAHIEQAIAKARAEAWDEGRAAQAARALRVKCSLVPVAKLRNPYRAALAAPETEGLT